ncbi:MAG: hypothetical protein ING75_08965 [Rhodocyclaceae bacterium]|nr:hypothetical protein [Rhodocyclaceae bacterium]
MITDDARVTDALGCQVETWLRREPGPPRVTEFWALPACNPTGNIEMTLGGATRQEAGEPRQSTIQAQLKTILIPLETDGFGLGIAAGVLRRDGRGAPASPIDSAYLYAPMSKALAGDRVVLHLNIGASHDRNERKTFRTWGLGSETAITSRIYLIAETFGDGTGAPFRHAGFRFWLLPNRLQLDTTHGQRAGSANSRWISVGMRVLLPPK